MSNTDPLLKELKGYVLALCQASEEKDIDDGHPLLLPFCETLEKIFNKGLKNNPGLFGSTKREYWSWMETLPNMGNMSQFFSLHNNIIQYIKESPKVKTNVGRGRLYIRYALMHRNLVSAIEVMQINEQFLARMYDPASVVGNCILNEILVSLLKLVQEINFKLNLNNSSFLDETWSLPIYKKCEFLPCEHLGVKICFHQERVIVGKVEDNSPAKNVLESGDVIDEVSGEPMAKCNRYRAQTLLKRINSQPVIMAIVKCKMSDGSMFRPLVPILKEANLESEMTPTSEVNDSVGNKIYYLGCCFVGQIGTMDVIDIGLKKLMDDYTNNEHTEVTVEFTDSEVMIMDACTHQLVLKSSFTQISSCGRRLHSKKFFAFIVGDAACNVAKEFFCHAFEADSEDRSKEVLEAIAQGFTRTKWAV